MHLSTARRKTGGAEAPPVTTARALGQKCFVGYVSDVVGSGFERGEGAVCFREGDAVSNFDGVRAVSGDDSDVGFAVQDEFVNDHESRIATDPRICQAPEGISVNRVRISHILGSVRARNE